MTISSTTNRVAYTGNGVTTAFAFPYKFLDDADLKVYVDDVLKTLTTDYTVSGEGEDSGGTVTFVVAPANSTSVVILRDPAVTQGLDLVENDPLPAESVENAFDKLTMIAQRLDDRLDRAFVLTDSDVSSPDLTIPSPVADEVIKWNATGTGLESATVAELGAITLPLAVNQGGTGSSSAAAARTSLGARGVEDDVPLSPGKVIVFEGATDDTFETTLTVIDPTADRTLSLPNKSGTIATVDDVASSVQIQPISASVGSNALTISASALALDFRSDTLGSGVVTTVSGTPSNLVISSGSTLGTVSGQQSRIAVLALNNAGTIELAAVNVAGGNDLSETGLISTTAEGGAGAADSASTIYSTTARTNVAYRVIGYVESTQATAGTWATAPSTIQGAGGQAMTAMSSLGYGQTWQTVTRTSGTTYYNTTGRPIFVFLNLVSTASNQTLSLVVAGVTLHSNTNTISTPGANYVYSVSFIVGPGESWVATTSLTINAFEKR